MKIHSFKVDLIELIVAQKNLRNKEHNDLMFSWKKKFDLFILACWLADYSISPTTGEFYNRKVEVVFKKIENLCENGNLSKKKELLMYTFCVTKTIILYY